jgi:hypothetical protein
MQMSAIQVKNTKKTLARARQIFDRVLEMEKLADYPRAGTHD